MFWTLLLYSNCYSILADIGYWYMEVCIMLTLPGRTFGTWRGAVGGTISYTYKITRRENVLLQWNHWHLNTLVTACLFMIYKGFRCFITVFMNLLRSCAQKIKMKPLSSSNSSLIFVVKFGFKWDGSNQWYIYMYTVKPVYNGQPRIWQKWPLFEASEATYLSFMWINLNWPYI